jgi:hypothetical protein
VDDGADVAAGGAEKKGEGEEKGRRVRMGTRQGRSLLASALIFSLSLSSQNALRRVRDEDVDARGVEGVGRGRGLGGGLKRGGRGRKR